MFFFAGHGVQVAGKNYVVPIDAKIASDAEVEVESIDVASVLARMETARNRVNIVILDACGDNPFGRRVVSQFDGRPRSAPPGPVGYLGHGQASEAPA